jgi:hypothetical protein
MFDSSSKTRLQVKLESFLLAEVSSREIVSEELLVFAKGAGENLHMEKFSSSLYNVKHGISTKLTKVGIFHLQIYIIFWFIIYNLQIFQPKNIIYNLHVYALSDLQSTMKITAESTIYNLTSPPPPLITYNIGVITGQKRLLKL